MSSATSPASSESEPTLYIQGPNDDMHTDDQQDAALRACIENRNDIISILRDNKVIAARIIPFAKGDSGDGLPFISCEMRFADDIGAATTDYTNVGAEIERLVGYDIDAESLSRTIDLASLAGGGVRDARSGRT